MVPDAVDRFQKDTINLLKGTEAVGLRVIRFESKCCTPP